MPQPRNPLHLPVRTASGQKLGAVVDITIDADTHSVLTYHVKPNRLVPDVMATPLLIDRSQVLEITDTEMVVDDNVERRPASQTAPLAST